ncbi:MAG TPA: roadblock/LC7 domain-containing protein [Anaerolineae bacterium]|nr:roadblock/LC7 domain-containing protein [Anaerolineae bacterium]
MEQLLADINAVAGVKGSFVCDAEGALVARALPAPFDETRILPAARTILQTIEGLETTRRRKVQELDILFRDARMVVKNLRVGCLYVVCARNINVPLLNLTANLSAKKLTEMLKQPEPETTGAPAVAVAEEEAAAIEEVTTADPSALLLARAHQIIGAAAQRGVCLRLLGGMAVKAICDSAASMTLPPEGLDLDLAVYGKDRKQLDLVMEDLGYEPQRRFNALHGQRRLKYFNEQQGIALDVFVDTFHMCHRLAFADRLELSELTLPLADLLLSKLQIVQMGEKDLRDIYAILCDHELGHLGDVDSVEASYIGSICSDDWGWYKTITLNLAKSMDLVDDFLADEEREIYVSRARQLMQVIEAVPKSLRWQARARIGEAKRWYDLPEE